MKCTETNKTSNREMITISRAEYEAMQAQLDAKTAELAQALLQNRWLMEQLKLNKRKLFGSSSEQLDQMVMDKFAYLFNEAEAWDADSVESAKKGEKKNPRKRRSGRTPKRSNMRNQVHFKGELCENWLGFRSCCHRGCGTQYVSYGNCYGAVLWSV